jgi:heptosyltransferase III
MKPLDLPPDTRILVVALRRLGDVLFATSLTASLRRAFPGAAIDVLVFEDTAGILSGNPDINRIVTMPARPSFWQGVSLAMRLVKRYDLAVSTQTGDRPTLFTLIAGRHHVGPIETGTRGMLRGLALSRSVVTLPGLHRLEHVLRLADALGIARVEHLVCPSGVPVSDTPEHAPKGQRENGTRPYAVIHTAPMFQYKRWTADGWRALATHLCTRGLRVVATGGPAPEERAYLDLIWADHPEVERRDGQLSWPELAALLSGAQVFIGPDTSVTHLAAATGCPTIVLFGPTDPRIWGPVPAGGLDAVWEASGTLQCRKNVWLVQHPLPCLPCQNEGCERHVLSFSRCLDELQPVQVQNAVDQALGLAASSFPFPAWGAGKRDGRSVDVETTGDGIAG